MLEDAKLSILSSTRGPGHTCDIDRSAVLPAPLLILGRAAGNHSGRGVVSSQVRWNTDGIRHLSQL